MTYTEILELLRIHASDERLPPDRSPLQRHDERFSTTAEDERSHQLTAKLVRFAYDENAPTASELIHSILAATSDR